jgi:hypothetical protein
VALVSHPLSLSLPSTPLHRLTPRSPPSSTGLLIEYWKLTKAFNVTFHRHPPRPLIAGSPEASEAETAMATSLEPQLNGGMKLKVFDKIFGVPLPFVMKWKLSDSYTTSKTREYDAIATVHLLYVVIPIVFGYSIYSLIHASVGYPLSVSVSLSLSPSLSLSLFLSLSLISLPPFLFSSLIFLLAQVILLLVSWQLGGICVCLWVCVDDPPGRPAA